MPSRASNRYVDKRLRQLYDDLHEHILEGKTMHTDTLNVQKIHDMLFKMRLVKKQNEQAIRCITWAESLPPGTIFYFCEKPQLLPANVETMILATNDHKLLGDICVFADHITLTTYDTGSERSVDGTQPPGPAVPPVQS